MEPAVYSASLAIFLFATTSVLTKFIIPKIGGPYSFLTVELLFALPVVSSVLIVTQNIVNPAIFQRDVFSFFFLSAVLAFIGFTSLMIGFSKGSASAGGIFISSRIIINIPLAYIFLEEYYPNYIYIFIIITFIGALIVTWDGEMKIQEVILLQGSGTKWFFLTMISWGLSNVFVTKIGDQLSPFQFITYRQILLVIFSLLLYPVLQEKIDGRKPALVKEVIGLLFAYILLTSAAQFLFIYSLQISLTITEGIGAFEGVATFLITMVFASIWNSTLQEPMKKTIVIIRFCGAVLSTIGAILIIIFA